jgi:Cu/Zn superoxide dismutase
MKQGIFGGRSTIHLSCCDFNPEKCSMIRAHLKLGCIGRAVAVCALLGACSAPSGTAPPPLSAAERDAAAGRSAGLVASLKGLRSAVSGKVRVVDRADGVTVMVSAINLPNGQYRVAFHPNGNCSSPNGFSAGPPWAPPGMDPKTLVPPFMNQDGNTEASTFVRGVHTTGENGLAGRSVVIYWGGLVTDAQPDVPNNRMACGVFEPAQMLLF